MPARRTRVNHLLVADLAPGHGAVEITLAGELDISNATDLGELLESWIIADPDARCVTIDAAELTFADSSGVQVLMDLRRQLLASDRVLEVRAPTRAVRRILETLGLVSLLCVEPERSPCDARRA